MFVLNYQISGCNGYSEFSIKLSAEIMLPIIEKILDVCEYSSNGMRYPSSEIY